MSLRFLAMTAAIAATAFAGDVTPVSHPAITRVLW